MSDSFPFLWGKPQEHSSGQNPDAWSTPPPPAMNGQENDEVEEKEINIEDIPREKEQFSLEKDIIEGIARENVQFVEKHIPEEGNGGMAMMEVANNHNNNNNDPMPVFPGESGVGLPYAPIDWPNPGDNWTWRVGRRFNSSGYFQDRFLYPPVNLQKNPRVKMCFGSKTAVTNFLRLEFPGADIDAFFASFTWKIKAKMLSPTKVDTASLFVEDPPKDETVKIQQEEKEEIPNSRLRKRKPIVATVQEEQIEETPPSKSRKRKQNAAKIPEDKEGTPRSKSRKGKQNAATSSATPNRRTRHTSRQSVPFTTGPEGDKGFVAPHEAAVNIPEDFDNYLNALEDIITQPLCEILVPPSATHDSPAPEDELAEARTKLSSLLVMDFPSLLSSKNFSELLTLASKLRKDPRISAEQLVKLKLIEEVPSFSEIFLDSRETIEQVDKCFVALESNKAKVSSLKNEYNELKEKADQLQVQVDCSNSAVQEIDNQIAELQAWRAELTNKIETNKAAKVEVTFAQKMVANEIPTVVHEIQLANSKVPEWELKRTNAEKREAEILAKFAPLKGFSL